MTEEKPSRLNQIRFHDNHGANIILFDDNTIAYRKASFNDGVAFTERPLQPGEVFLVEINEIEPGWTGHMRIGLTQLNPGESTQEEIPSFSLPDLLEMRDSWIWAINKSHATVDEEGDNGGEAQENDPAGRNLSPLERRIPINCDTDQNPDRPSIMSSFLPQRASNEQTEPLATDVGCHVGVVYIPNGNFAEVHYIVNGRDNGIFTKKLPYLEAPLYGVVDVYGATKQVRIVQYSHLVPSLKQSCRLIILKHIARHGVSGLPLPKALKDYLRYQS